MAQAPGNEFSSWAEKWILLADFKGTRLIDEDRRVGEALELWNEPIPPGWERDGFLDRLLKLEKRNCRGEDGEGQHRGEYLLERCVLEPSPADWMTLCLGSQLVDGVNGFPLAKGRTVEADMLLLVRDDGGYGLQLVEVKVRSQNAWYAAVESLRQLKLFEELFKADPAVRTLFHERKSVPDLPSVLPRTAVVLAPIEFYELSGKRRESVQPAARLLNEVSTRHGVRAQLAIWDSDRRTAVSL